MQGRSLDMTRRNRIELPPTAGLPLRFADFVTRPDLSLEKGVVAVCGVPDPVITCSGTVALLIALSVLRAEDETRCDVVIPAYTCPIIPLLKARLPWVRFVPCDVREDSLDLDLDALERLCGTRTLAVVVTHLGGRVAVADGAIAIAHACGASVVEDAAQSMGAVMRGESVGLRGDVGFFSLAVGKGLTMFEGGALFSSDPALHDALRSAAGRLLRPDALLNLRRSAELLGYTLCYRPDHLWWVYGRRLAEAVGRGDEIAAVADAFSPDDIPVHAPDEWRKRVCANALVRLPAFLAEGRARALPRAAILRDAGAFVFGDPEDAEGVWPVIMVGMGSREARDAVLDELWTAGLGVTRLFARALPDYPFLDGFLERGADCPNARRLAETILTVTNSPWLDDGSFSRIAEVIRTCIRG